LTGALERIESGGALRIRDALFVGRDDASGEINAAAMTTGGASGMIGRLISFRLDPETRRRATEQAMSGPTGEVARSLAETLEPGAAVAVLLVEHVWAQTLEDSVARMGGGSLRNEFVAASGLPEALAS
jgi:hypothetical protein